MLGFIVFKLFWVKDNELDIYKQIVKVLLFKDYLCFKFSGEYVLDMFDSVGMSWLDVGKCSWSKFMLMVCGLNELYMFKFYEGNEVIGYLYNLLVEKWGMKLVVIVVGVGDNVVGVIGCGIVELGQVMLLFGILGVYFVVINEFCSKFDFVVYSFCYVMLDCWYLMFVMLSVVSCFDWYVCNVGYQDVVSLINNVVNNICVDDLDILFFLFYFIGECIFYNNLNVKVGFFGIIVLIIWVQMVQVVIQGVFMVLVDGIDVVYDSGVSVDGISLIGGGVKSVYWCQLLVNVFGIVMDYCEGGDVGFVLGVVCFVQVVVNLLILIFDICLVFKKVGVYEFDLILQDYFCYRCQKFCELYFSFELYF